MAINLEFLNRYYDKIYVLSVATASSRRALFAEQFSALNYEFFYGADKNHFSVEDAKNNGTYNHKLAVRHHRYSKEMKHGEIACSWSHRMIYEDMLKSGYSRVLIFEDDAVPDPKQLYRIPEILNEIPADCELLMWGWDKNGRTPFSSALKKLFYHLQHNLGLLKWNHTVIRNLYAKPYSAHLKKAGFHDYTYAYAVNRSAAEKLIKMQTPLQYIADNLLAHAAATGVVSSYITYPAVFLHDSLPDGTHRDSYIR